VPQVSSLLESVFAAAGGFGCANVITQGHATIIGERR
jgi:hypothetical protein